LASFQREGGGGVSPCIGPWGGVRGKLDTGIAGPGPVGEPTVIRADKGGMEVHFLIKGLGFVRR